MKRDDELAAIARAMVDGRGKRVEVDPRASPPCVACVAYPLTFAGGRVPKRRTLEERDAEKERET